MKNLYTFKIFKIFFLSLFTVVGFSQTRGITYQAVIYDPQYKTQNLPGVDDGLIPYANKSLCIRFEITDIMSKSVYIETQSTTTDQFGMVNLIIGQGNRVGGTAPNFESIKWNSDIQGLVVGMDTSSNCTSFTEISNQPFTATPFSLGVSSIDPDNLEQLANKSTNVTTDAGSDTKYPSVKAIKTYVDTQIADATMDASTTDKGKIKLAGDISGTADAPKVVKIQSTAVSTSAPLTNQYLKFDGTTWVPTSFNLITEKIVADTTNNSSRSFTLTHNPLLKPSFYINGIKISDEAISVTGNNLVYDATKNGNFLIDSGDEINISYQF